MLVTALATPFFEGKIDLYCYEKLVSCVAEHSDALLALGTTAEASLLTDDERKLLVRAVKRAAPHLPLIVGVDSPCTNVAAVQAERAAEWGANALLVTPPAFVRCTAEGFTQHVRQIAQIGLPIMLYNAPSRCGYTLEFALQSALPLADCVKDAGQDMSFTRRLARDTAVLCGNEGMLAQFLANGAKGVVSVVANIAPRLVKAVLTGTADQKAITLFDRLAALTMREVNPIPIKYMLYKKGVFRTCDVRLPLTAADEQTRQAIEELSSEEWL